MDICGLTGIFESLEACDERLSPILTMLVSSDLEVLKPTPDQKDPNLVFDQETLDPTPESQEDLYTMPHLEVIDPMPIHEALNSKSDQEADSSIPRPGALNHMPESQEELDPTPKLQEDLNPTPDREALDPPPIHEALNSKSDQEADSSIPRPGALNPMPKSQEELFPTPKSLEDLNPTPDWEALDPPPIHEALNSKSDQEADSSIPRYDIFTTNEITET
ncbi:histone-lysine N-methyltransferase 2D-like [Pecten maximus]|uniref:histone-lysine N-methyltransferase 2D-like n=1 Tax=Pecten maximus TaxID=6579 RepID=UPI001458E3CD|nr:histone-lysine N-methyltransferase 2D-like [Pecten maximus]